LPEQLYELFNFVLWSAAFVAIGYGIGQLFRHFIERNDK
jgi:hypothetical protein